MIVRLLKPWKYRKVGTILNDMPDGAANVLIRRRFAEEVKRADLLPNHAASANDRANIPSGAVESE